MAEFPDSAFCARLGLAVAVLPVAAGSKLCRLPLAFIAVAADGSGRGHGLALRPAGRRPTGGLAF